MYVEGMNKTLFQVFKSYCAQLMRYESVIMTKQDLLVTEDSLGKSLFAQKVIRFLLQLLFYFALFLFF